MFCGQSVTQKSTASGHNVSWPTILINVKLTKRRTNGMSQIQDAM
jgi:hypothetical protein